MGIKQAGPLPAEALVVLSHGKTHFLLHVHPILAGSRLDEGPVKEIPVVRDIHTWFHLDRMSSCLLSTTAHFSNRHQGAFNTVIVSDTCT